MEKQSMGPDEFARKMIETYSNTVYRLAYSLVNNHYDADDIHQEVFIRYLKKRPLFQNTDNERAWFLRVTINCCKNHWKSAWMRRITGFTEDNLPPYFELEPEDLELIEAVKKLPEKYRMVIHLFYYEDLSIDAISKVTGIKLSTIRTQLTRARKMLKKGLEDGYVSEQL